MESKQCILLVLIVKTVLNPERNLCGNIISHNTQEHEMYAKYDKRVS